MISKKVIIKVTAIISKSCMQYRNISISYSTRWLYTASFGARKVPSTEIIFSRKKKIHEAIVLKDIKGSSLYVDNLFRT